MSDTHRRPPVSEPPPIAARLADFASGARLAEVPPEIVDAAVRAFANAVGVSLGGVPLEAARAVEATVAGLGGPVQARVLGTGHGAPVDRVALVDGVLAHVLDYDDTDLATILHPSAPVLAALLPLAEWRGASGADFLIAWIVGLETGIRLARALARPHYDHGWHVTATAGGVAAAIACATLLRLDRARFAHAIGIAATQAGGHREQFGFMTKSLHVGIAGHAGLMAALLAGNGVDASPVSLDGRRGMLAVMAPEPEPGELDAELGERWRIADNCIKPYASGVVTHPAIDGARTLHDRGIRPADVERLDLDVHPLVAELTGKVEPRTGLEAKFSVSHCAAVGLIAGRAGPRQFTDDVVTDPDIDDLRRRIFVHPSPDVAHMTAVVRARLRDGTEHTVRVDPTRGTRQRQLTDAELEDKFLDASTVILTAQQAGALWTALRHVASAPSIGDLVTQTIADR